MTTKRKRAVYKLILTSVIALASLLFTPALAQAQSFGGTVRGQRVQPFGGTVTGQRVQPSGGTVTARPLPPGPEEVSPPRPGDFGPVWPQGCGPGGQFCVPGQSGDRFDVENR